MESSAAIDLRWLSLCSAHNLQERVVGVPRPW